MWKEKSEIYSKRNWYHQLFPDAVFFSSCYTLCHCHFHRINPNRVFIRGVWRPASFGDNPNASGPWNHVFCPPLCIPNSCGCHTHGRTHIGIHLGLVPFSGGSRGCHPDWWQHYLYGSLSSGPAKIIYQYITAQANKHLRTRFITENTCNFYHGTQIRNCRIT